MEFINNYSGIIALFVYGILLFLLMSFTKKKEVKEETEEVKTVNAVRTPLDLNDEDATVACLVAAIECREECHKNVTIRNVRRVA